MNIMEITKEKLEEKRALFIEEHKRVSNELNEKIIMAHKLEGAIEAVNILLKELENEPKNTINTNME